MFVVEAAVSALFQTLFQFLTSDVLLKFARREGLHSQVEKMKKLLETIEVFLVDADMKRFTNASVKKWLEELQDLAFDLEDMLDEFSTQELLKGKEKHGGFAFGSLFKSEKLKSKMEKMVSRWEDIDSRTTALGLKRFVIGESSAAPRQEWRRQQQSISQASVPRVFGFVEVGKKLNNLVLKNNDSEREKLHVIAVIGMGGIGKTTLVQLVYKDAMMDKHFDLVAWVCVSDQFNFQKIMETVLRQVGGVMSGNETLEEILKKLKEKIASKKVLIVLDDVWKNDTTEWDVGQTLFRDVTKHTVLVLTTRDEKVAKAWGAEPEEFLSLGTLKDEDCWLIFKQAAFGNRDDNRNNKLEAFKSHILKKCDGLPLTAKILGSLFKSETNEDEWEHILQNKLWELIEEDKQGVLPALGLSYYYLPAPLKQCFSFCSIFPKDYEFEEQEIVLMWMGQGFLQEPTREMEDVGHQYFHTLLSRAFFQQSPNKISLYVMHDLIQDLAQWAASKVCFQLKKPLKTIENEDLPGCARYAYIPNYWDDMRKMVIINKTNKLRALVYHILETGNSVEPVHFHQLLPKSPFLRVISLKNCHFSQLPDSIGDLKQLRFLDLSYTEIKRLPKSICSLVNLQSLLLKHCYSLEALPKDMNHLINLRHLDISSCRCITEMPKRMSKLQFLQCLPIFIIAKSSGGGIQELNPLPLRGSLFISNLQSVTSSSDAKEANLNHKSKIEVLSLKWDRPNNDLLSEEIAETVIEELQPTKNLKELVIKGYYGRKYPTWLCDPHFSKMTSLTLVSCDKCISLPPLGRLPLLERLHIEALNGVNSVGLEFYGEDCSNPFHSLKYLRFKQMENWKDWTARSDDRAKVFSCLKELTLDNCRELLGELPYQLPELEKLVIRSCDNLEVLVPSTMRLQELEVVKCKKVECNYLIICDSLNSVVLEDIEEFNVTSEGFLQVTKLQSLSIADKQGVLMHLWQKTLLMRQLTSVTNLSFSECSQLELLRGIATKELRLSNCTLKELLKILHNMNSSFRLNIDSCPGVAEISDGLAFVYDSDNNASQLSIDISRCEALTFLVMSKFISMSKFLVTMEIWGCTSLTTMFRGHIPPTLTSLGIENCDNLKSLVEEDNLQDGSTEPLLSTLFIKSCRSLVYLASSTRGKLPFRFKSLQIYFCESLTSLLSSPSSSSSILELPADLKSLYIKGSPKLKIVAGSFHPDSCNNLNVIDLAYCDSLMSLPIGLHHHLSQLDEISITECPKLEAQPDVTNVNNFPARRKVEITNSPAVVCCILSGGCRGIHNSLRELKIPYPKRSTFAKPMSEWGLKTLVSLEKFTIYGDDAPDVVSFIPEKTPALPSSLTELAVARFSELKHVTGSVFQNLNSLKVLQVRRCPKLESFPKEGLPPSLYELKIRHCPLLGEGCRKKKGKIWSKVAHIPLIKIQYFAESGSGLKERCIIFRQTFAETGIYGFLSDDYDMEDIDFSALKC